MLLPVPPVMVFVVPAVTVFDVPAVTVFVVVAVTVFEEPVTVFELVPALPIVFTEAAFVVPILFTGD